MVRMFGDVPYYTEAYFANPLPRTDKSVVLKNCLVDLQTFLDNDPEGKNSALAKWKWELAC